MTRIRAWNVGAFASALLWVGAAGAQSPAPAAAQDLGDQRFLSDALGVNQLELRLGQLAVERATSPQVKSDAEKMVAKHSSLGQQLSDLSRKAGGTGEARMTPDQERTLAAMQSQPAGSFDATFKKTVDDGHVKELAMYEAEVDRAHDPALRDLATERVGALRKSLAGATGSASTTESMGSGSASGGGMGSSAPAGAGSKGW